MAPAAYPATSYPAYTGYRRSISQRLPHYRSVNHFEDYYASSFNGSAIASSCPTAPTTCPICLDKVDEKVANICDYKNIFEAKFEDLETNFRFNVTKKNVIRALAAGANNALKQSYDFIISEKCLDQCSQLDSTSGLLLLVKEAPTGNNGECVAFDENVVIVPSTYLNQFDTKTLITKEKCSGVETSLALDDASSTTTATN